MDRKYLPVVLFCILVFGIFIFELGLPIKLGSVDGQNHWSYAQYDDCSSGYANAICWLTKPLVPFGEVVFWFPFFLVGAVLIPLLYYYFFRSVWVLLGYFVFTGFFWNVETMQVYSQLLISVFLIVFLFSKSVRVRLLLFNFLGFSWIFGLSFHQFEEYFLLIVFFIELFVLFYKIRVKIMQYVMLSACGVLPKNVVRSTGELVNSVRAPVSSNTGSFFQTLVYYVYAFFWENMFVGFIIPGLLYVWKTKNVRLFVWFFVIVFIAFVSWFLTGWEVWYVTRFLLFIPIILLVPFMEWLMVQERYLKFLFIFLGVCYFYFSVFYFVQRKIDMGCGF